MKVLALRLMRAMLNAVYAVMKAVTREHGDRVLFLSRQGNSMQFDFQLIIDELEKLPHAPECVVICCRSDKDLASRIRYSWAFMRSMYYLATSRVCVLNSYWPATSILRHRDSLLVIQIWHAAGKIKQSGYQTLDRDMGHSSVVARELKMHKGYDIVIAGAKAWNPFYCASFGISEDTIANVGLPRFDFLQTEGERVRERFFAAYPELRDRRIVLYVPTFRAGLNEGAAALVQALSDDARNAVIFRRHPNQKPIALNDRMVYLAPDFSTLELLLVSDYVVTDYSAVAVEAASVPVKTLYYCFDIESYIAKNGLNVDPRSSMPSCVYTDAGQLAHSLDEPYPEAEFEAYRAKYVLPPEDLGHSTERIVSMIRERLDIA